MAPAENAEVGKMQDGGFELICQVQAEGLIPVSKYRSTKTGLTICLAEVEGPVVNGYFCLATEAHDDDGIPHTLEHLVFMGSEDYPYKGVLDLLANRCLASGTNAVTDTDNTYYTVETAGAEGFLRLLPIYLDHILYPLLSDAGFITEVHHVNGEGEDAGVVYCEMQGRENSGESLTHLAMLRCMFPPPSGYCSETGGIMKNLRESTTNEKIRNYHKYFYRPENLCLIISGPIKIQDIIKALQPIEAKILSKPKKPPFVRPWQTPVPPLKESVDKLILYPCDDEKNGLVIAAWRGPNCHDLYTTAALNQILEYLTDTAISPLQRDFVEQESPFCTRIAYSFIENFESCVYLHFENVPVAKMALIKERLKTVLQNISKGTEPLDLKRMRTLVHRKMLAILSAMESNPHELISQHFIGDFLYGDKVEEFKERFDQAKLLRKMEEEPETFWLSIMNKYLTENHMVLVCGEPSKQLMETMTTEEKGRVAQQREKLGVEGLQQKEKELQEAIEQNEVPAPIEMLNKVKVPDISSIQFHSVHQSCNVNPKLADSNPKFPLNGLPVHLQLDDINSNFVQLYAILNSSEVPQDLRLYIPLFIELLLESPILKDTGELKPHTAVIAQLAEDTVRTATSVGLDHGQRFNCGSYAQAVRLAIRVEMEKYEIGVGWLHSLLFDTQFTIDRLRILANKMVNDVDRVKRHGYSVTRMMIRDLCFNKESNHFSSNVLRQHTFLSLLLLQLDSNPNKVIDNLNQLRNLITSADNLIIHMATNVAKLSQLTDPRQPWMTFLPQSNSTVSKPLTLKRCHELLLPVSQSPLSGVIVGVGAVESAFFIQCVPSVTSHLHPDLPAILVLIQYLTQLEGPMWRQIRGLGLAYNYNISVKLNEGLMYLDLAKCTHVVSAYKEAKKIVENILSDTAEWDMALLDSARSSLIFEIIETEKSVTDMSRQSLLSYYRDGGLQCTKKLLSLISEVSIEDLKRVGPKYLSPLFDQELSRCAVCCHPSKVDEVLLGFKNCSRQLTIVPSLEEGLFCSLPQFS